MNELTPFDKILSFIKLRSLCVYCEPPTKLVSECYPNLSYNQWTLLANRLNDSSSYPVDPGNYKIWCTHTGNFKYLPALLSIADLLNSIPDGKSQNITVYSSGSWMTSLTKAVNDLICQDKIILDCRKSDNFSEWRSNELNLDKSVPLAVMDIICNMLPKDRRVLPEIYQGILLSCLQSAGIKIGRDAILETRRPSRIETAMGVEL